jgi:hypothetical protein
VKVNYLNIRSATEREINLLIKQFGRLDIEEEENPRQQFTYTGILDVYDHCLTEKEASELLSSFEEHNLKYEKRFLSFLI